MPIVLDRNLLRREVRRFERVGRGELRDGLVDPAGAAQVVAVHMPRVRERPAPSSHMSRPG